MVRMESLQVLKLIFESIWGSKFDFRHQKKIAKEKLSNAFKALQNESLKVLNQCLETIYEYKSYFCIFSFFTFCSYFPGIPRCSHCASPLWFPVVSPRWNTLLWVVLPRFWVEVLEPAFPLTRARPSSWASPSTCSRCDLFSDFCCAAQLHHVHAWGSKICKVDNCWICPGNAVNMAKELHSLLLPLLLFSTALQLDAHWLGSLPTTGLNAFLDACHGKASDNSSTIELKNLKLSRSDSDNAFSENKR